MVSVKIYDRENDVEYGALITENNYDGEVVVREDFHCDAAEDGFDTIFGTNDRMITIVLDPAVAAKRIAEHITDHIVSEHCGETYDDDLVNRCIADYFSELHGEVTYHVDQKMKKDYLKEDNLTIKNKEDTKYFAQCSHDCDDCAGYETTGDCNHGCFDCMYFDGGECTNLESNYYGCLGDECAADCHTWSNGE